MTSPTPLNLFTMPAILSLLGFSTDGCGDQQRSQRDIVGATCPYADFEAFQLRKNIDTPLSFYSCKEPIPWLSMFDEGLFGAEQVCLLDSNTL